MFKRGFQGILHTVTHFFTSAVVVLPLLGKPSVFQEQESPETGEARPKPELRLNAGTSTLTVWGSLFGVEGLRA